MDYLNIFKRERLINKQYFQLSINFKKGSLHVLYFNLLFEKVFLLAVTYRL